MLFVIFLEGNISALLQLSWDSFNYKKIKHDAAKEEVMQKGNFWHFKNAFSCSAGSESSMTFSSSLPKFGRMTQGEGIPTNLKVKGVLCTGLPQSQDWGIVYSWELLQFPAGLLKSLWMKKEPALHMGWGKTRHLSGYQDTERVRKLSCQQYQKEPRNCSFPFETFNHLMFYFPFMLLKKTTPPKTQAAS